MRVNVEVSIQLYAPIDLVWELLLESSYEKGICPVSGLEGGEILEEYEDGLLRYVTFKDRPLKQRVHLNDDNYMLVAKFEGDYENGYIKNQLKEMTPNFEVKHEVDMNIYCSWESDENDILNEHELHSLLGIKTKEFKAIVENIWAEKLEN
jgi:hypothetical protein